jgi:hypothetical protein
MWPAVAPRCSWVIGWVVTAVPKDGLMGGPEASKRVSLAARRSFARFEGDNWTDDRFDDSDRGPSTGAWSVICAEADRREVSLWTLLRLLMNSRCDRRGGTMVAGDGSFGVTGGDLARGLGTELRSGAGELAEDLTLQLFSTAPAVTMVG